MDDSDNSKVKTYDSVSEWVEDTVSRNKLAVFMLVAVLSIFLLDLGDVNAYAVIMLFVFIIGIYSVYAKRKFGYYFTMFFWFYLFNTIAGIFKLPYVFAIAAAVILYQPLSAPAKKDTSAWGKEDTILLLVCGLLSLSFLIQLQINQFIYDVLPSQQKTDNQLLEKAITQQNPQLCQQIQTQETKDQCYEKLSRLLNDVTLCKKIEYTTKKDNCVSEWSRLNNNNSFCHLIEWEGQRKTCEGRGS